MRTFCILFAAAFFLFCFGSQAIIGAPDTLAATGPLNVTYNSSIATRGSNPLRIAFDSAGLLYVAVPSSGKVLKFSKTGSPAGTVDGFKSPVSVAVDSAGKIYVGDSKDGSVSVVSQRFAGVPVTTLLGRGRGEFGIPGAIAVSSGGTVYVTDSRNNVVKVYNSDGSFQTSFGGFGSGAGQMIFPTGIAIDDGSQEVYVVDHTNGRVEVFDLQGAYRRSFGAFGSGQGLFTRPHGIRVEGGKVYVADAFQSNVQVFDTAGNFIAVAGQFGSGPGTFKIPMDVVRNGTKLYVSNSDNQRIEVFDVQEPQDLTLVPQSLSFTASAGANPAAQMVQISPSVAGSTVAWTSTVSAPFGITVSPSTGMAPSTVNVGVNVAGLAAGTYTGTVNFNANGANYPLVVRLTVSALAGGHLQVAPGSLDLLYQKGGTLASKSLSITSGTTVLSWAASANVPWLSVSPSSGTTPGTANVALTQNVSFMADGTYTGSVAVTAQGDPGSPYTVPVSLKVVTAGTITVTTNLSGASFSITGPAAYSGSGTSWTTDQAVPGTYTISFGYVKGYRRPATRSFVVDSGKSVTIGATYQLLDIANIIVAAKGAGSANDSLVRVLDLNGTLISEFRAFANALYGAVVATADIDGDGTSEIIAGTGAGPLNAAAINVFRADGTLLSSVAPVPNTQYGANIAVGDVFGDGKHEVAMSMVSATSGEMVVIYQFSGYNLVEKARIYISSGGFGGGGSSVGPAELAWGDVDGDGILELIVSRQGTVTIYALSDTFAATPLLTTAVTLPGGGMYGSAFTVAAGDVNGDGVDEILLGYTDGANSYTGFYNGSLVSQAAPLKVFAGGSAPGLASMDMTGDGVAEILAGKGASSLNDGTLRVYDFTGVLLKEINVFGASTWYGVNAAFGVKK